MLVRIARAEIVVMMAHGQMPQLMGYIPVLANQLPVARHRDDSTAPDSQGVGGRKLCNAYDFNSQVLFQPIREGPDEAIAEHRPHGCRRLGPVRQLPWLGIRLAVGKRYVRQGLFVAGPTGDGSLPGFVVEVMTRRDADPVRIQLTGDKPVKIRIDPICQPGQLD